MYEKLILTCLLITINSSFYYFIYLGKPDFKKDSLKGLTTGSFVAALFAIASFSGLIKLLYLSHILIFNIIATYFLTSAIPNFNGNTKAQLFFSGNAFFSFTGSTFAFYCTDIHTTILIACTLSLHSLHNPSNFRYIDKVSKFSSIIACIHVATAFYLLELVPFSSREVGEFIFAINEYPPYLVYIVFVIIQINEKLLSSSNQQENTDLPELRIIEI